MTALADVCGVLEANALPHALIGAAALAVRGIARSTYDIDLLTTDPRALDARLWSVFRDAVEIRRGDVDDPLAGVIRIARPADRPIDVIVGKHRWQARAIARAEHLPGGPPVVLARDLILLKLYAGGSQDLWDIRELLQQQDDLSLEADVTADLLTLPGELQDRWQSVGRR
jgi:hypothetical protein